MFFQVYDKGFMEDGEGRFIDFKNALILLTTNAGTDLIASLCKVPDLMPGPRWHGQGSARAAANAATSSRRPVADRRAGSWSRRREAPDAP